jgi:glycosyltransferase involved in cell wall biosynthesis
MNAPCSKLGDETTVEPFSRVAFFHQNDVFQTLGGIERYVATIFDGAPERVVLVSAPGPRDTPRLFGLDLKASPGTPQSIRFLRAVFSQRKAIDAFLRENGVRVMEFSRPEYILAGLLFRGKRVVTIHGTGPDRSYPKNYIAHHACCLLLPFFADRVQIVGRDPSGVSPIVRKLLGRRLAYFDAWHDECFTPGLLPSLARGGPLRVFYAGRISAQKNPELLFEIIRVAAREANGDFEFHYFGGDFDAFERAGLGGLVVNHGFLGPEALAEAIRSCHVGLMCSAFGEGSPYIVIEALACGRPYILPSLPTLKAAYETVEGAHFVERYCAHDYVTALGAVRTAVLAGTVDASAIAAGVAGRSRSRKVPELVSELARIAG